MHYKYTHSCHLLQEKIKKIFWKGSIIILEIPEKNLKKIFRKGNHLPPSGVLGGWYTHTPLHHKDNTLLWLFGRLWSVWSVMVGAMPVKIPLFAFLIYFLRLYRFFWYNYTFQGYMRLKWASFCFMLIQKDYKFQFQCLNIFFFPY